jgi:predicted ATP-dependent protease
MEGADHHDRRADPEQLYRTCDPALLALETSREVLPLDGMVGQHRAVHAIELGLSIRKDGYNLFVSGPAGSGRNTAVRAALRRAATEQPVPPDWCYTYDFHDTREPAVMSLPPGRAASLVKDMDELIEACKREIPRVLESDAFSRQREALVRQLQGQREELFKPLEQDARTRGFAINASPMGIATVPLKPDGKPMSQEEFEQLPEGDREVFQERGRELQSAIGQAMVQVRRLEKEAQTRLQEQEKAAVLAAVSPLVDELRMEYLDIPKAVEFLEHVQSDIAEHLSMFRSPEPQEEAPPFVRPPSEEFFTRYKVNPVVTNGADGGAPVVLEDNPTYYNLFGRVDYRSQLGAFSTDHTMIKAGALHRANGGYLVLQALDVLTAPLVWETLKRTLRCQECRIENMGEQYSSIPIATLRPQPIPLDVKVVLVGTPQIYHLLFRADDEFRKLFAVRADFSVDMERSEETIGLYTGFISSRLREEELRPFDQSALARVVEHGSRLAAHQGRLSTRFSEIGNVLTEADYWAGKDGAATVSAEHVEQAIEDKTYRSSLIEERIRDLIEDGTIMIDTDGAVTGQVNGLSVYDTGDYAFGRPTRITARVSLGRGRVISIEREINMSGRIHSKGFAILQGYLQGRYEQERPLSLSASIGFEQMYDEIDGDSASAAELYALLSSISRLPLKQGIAVTGSVNQRGEIQAIGAVNEKIEGHYAVCKAKGLTGDQGVIIPRQNSQHLMLRKEVVEAVRDGRFHIWLVSSVDEGMEVLTDVTAGEPDRRGRYETGCINRLVMDRLAQMARKVAGPKRPARKANSTTPEEDEQPPAS